MLKRSITYTNFNGVQETKDFYFNFTTPELTRILAKLGGTIEEHVAKLQANQDHVGMIEFIELLVLGSQGEKSADGSLFVKNEETRKKFEYSMAYAELFEELLTVEGSAAAFGQGLAAGAVQTEAPKSPTQLQKEKVARIMESHPEHPGNVVTPRYDPNTGELLEGGN